MGRPRLFASILFLFTAGSVAASTGIGEGRAALEAARAAYRSAGAFQETMEFVVEFPNGRREPKLQEYGVSEDGAAFLAISGNGQEIFRFVARDGKLVGIQNNVAGRYVEVPYRGDFADALRRLGADQELISTPPAVVARQGGDLEAFLLALRLGILAPAEVAGSRKATAEDGTPILEVDLRSANGQVTFGLDAASHRLRQFQLALGEGKQQVRASGRFTFRSGLAAPASPDLSGMRAVASLAEMKGEDYPVGQPAPQATFESLDGGTVSLADLRGSVVVLDFWATWCVPCWTGLQHTAELAAWAKSSGLPVKVYAVNTLEEVTGVEAQRRLAAEFLKTKKLDLPVLLDVDRKAFAAFRNPGLPSLIVLDREGRLARYEAGILPDMVAALRDEVVKLVK